MTLTFSEVVQNNGTPYLLFSGTFSGNSTFSLPTTLSLNAYDNQTVGGGSGNESISVFNLMDEAHNPIIQTPTTLDNGTTSGDWFLVDNQVPDNISVQFIDSSSDNQSCSLCSGGHFYRSRALIEANPAKLQLSEVGAKSVFFTENVQTKLQPGYRYLGCHFISQAHN